MEIKIRRIYNHQNQETGATLFVVLDRPSTIQEKSNIENRLKQFAFDNLYPDTGLIIYSEMFSDSPSIVVIKNSNDLPIEVVRID